MRVSSRSGEQAGEVGCASFLAVLRGQAPGLMAQLPGRSRLNLWVPRVLVAAGSQSPP